MSITHLKKIEYQIIDNKNLPLVFVGTTYYNQMLHTYFSTQGYESSLLSVEKIADNDQAWFDQHQFICVSSNVATKRFVTEAIAKKNPHYFSIVGGDNQFFNLTIGRGVFIEHNCVSMWTDTIIGNHVTIGSYVELGHSTQIGSYCHVSGYSFVVFANVGEGNCIATRTSILGSRESILTTATNCNFMVNSTVSKSIEETGTYYGNRRMNDNSSIVYDIL